MQETLSQKPTYQRIENAYISRTVLPELEKRKKQIAAKRKLFEPINREDLEDHEQRYKEQQEAKEAKRQEDLLKRKLEMAQMASQLPKQLKPKTALISYTEDYENEAPYDEKLQSQKRHEKRLRYGNLTREMYWPSIDQTKRLEILSLKEKEEAKVKSLTRKFQSEANLKTKTEVFRVKRRPKNMAKPSSSSVLPTQAEIENKRRPHLTDYLTERRTKRENLVSEGCEPVYVKPIINDIISNPAISDADRYNLVLKQSKKIENMAKQNELIYSDKSDTKSLEANGVVTNMYIDSIKAKLALLSAIN